MAEEDLNGWIGSWYNPKEASLELGLFEPDRAREREESCLTVCRKFTGKITTKLTLIK